VKIVIIESPYARDIVANTAYVRAALRDSVLGPTQRHEPRDQTLTTQPRQDTMKIHETTHTTVHVLDHRDPDAGDACHEYEVRDRDGTPLCAISFQHGPIGSAGVNGPQHVDLLAIIQHRLDCFQGGPFASAVNETTCAAIGSAMASEGTRTRRRTLAGVEGTDLPAKGVEA